MEQFDAAGPELREVWNATGGNGRDAVYLVQRGVRTFEEAEAAVAGF